MILAFLAFSAALLAQTPVESLIASCDDHKGVTVIEAKVRGIPRR